MYKHQHSEMMKNKELLHYLSCSVLSPALSGHCVGCKSPCHEDHTDLAVSTVLDLALKNTPKERVPSTFAYGNLHVGFLSGLSQVSP